jgi:hypothetical protein
MPTAAPEDDSLSSLASVSDRLVETAPLHGKQRREPVLPLFAQGRSELGALPGDRAGGLRAPAITKLPPPRVPTLSVRG